MGLSLAKFEKLDGALNAHLRAGDFETCADPRNWIRTFNILLDTAADCGMDRDHDDVTAWASERVLKTLLAA